MRRQVIVMRRAVRKDLLVETNNKPRTGRRRGHNELQSSLQFIDKNAPATAWEYAVLVSNTTYEIEAIGQLYRDRADCENGFDELKNQWGWGGYTTQDIECCNLSAQAVGLIYNWWSWYVRLAHPQARLEAITSRPPAAQCGRPQHPACRTATRIAQRDSRRSHPDQSADRQCLSRFAGHL